MKNKNVDFTWVEEVENIIKGPEFCKTITACQELLEEINALIPSSHMKFVKLNLSLAVDLLRYVKSKYLGWCDCAVAIGWFKSFSTD
jgi:hypothetical protein